jgi:regulator of sigma E protease
LISFLISAIKIIFLLGFLIGIHETGHFLIAKLCKVRVNEFAIGFGPVIWKKQGKETKYELRLIPLGGFVNMEGEAEQSEKEGSFTKASIPRRIAIVVAGALVNIIFAIIVYFILAMTVRGNLTNAVVGNRVLDADNFENRLYFASYNTKEFMLSIAESVKQLFTGKVSSAELVGPVGISEVVAKTNGFREFIYILAAISISLGVTNLLPFPPLDGGKIVLILLEAIRRKPLKQETEIKIQLAGFAVLMAVSIVVTYHDIVRIF